MYATGHGRPPQHVPIDRANQEAAERAARLMLARLRAFSLTGALYDRWVVVPVDRHGHVGRPLAEGRAGDPVAQ